MTLKPVQIKQISADGFCWNKYSPRVATISNDLTHFAPVAYFAFDSWDEAHNFFRAITDKRVCGRAQVRKSERFTSLPWEVKVWSLREDVLEKLTERDRSRLPKSLPLPPIRRDWSLSESHDAISAEAA